MTKLFMDEIFGRQDGSCKFCGLIVDQEPRGVRLAEKETNFNMRGCDLRT